MISAIYIFTLKGELLLQRTYASPAPPPQHVRAFSRTVLAGRAFSELAPVVCVGPHSAQASTAVSSFSCFVPPCVGAGSQALATSAAPPTSGVVPTAAVVRGRREGCWGTGGSDEDGVVYVAALRRNANVACVLEVLRRLAALVQAFCAAALHSAGSGPILPADFQASETRAPGSVIASAGAGAEKKGSALMGAVRRGLAGPGGGGNAVYVDASFVRRHFVLLYEILDEAIDGGFPQLLDLTTLRKFTSFGNGPGFHWPPEHSAPVGGLSSAASLRRAGDTGAGLARAFGRGGARAGGGEGDIAASKQITSQVTGACSWRAPGIRYRRNEVFIDVIESVDVLLSQNGVVLRSDVNGEVVVNSQLSGMPECKFGLNDRLPIDQTEPHGAAGRRQRELEKKDPATPGVTLDDCRFHQCVRLTKFDVERTISFIPPDGTFRLMTYRISEGISLPFKIFPLLQERSDSRMECLILLKALFDRNVSASNVEVVIPCPPNFCDLQLLHVGIGKASVDNAQQAVIWKIKRYPGAMEYLLRYELSLSSQRSGLLSREAMALRRGCSTPTGGEELSLWKRPPLTLRFTLHMFTASGLCIRYLKITEKSNYRTVKWIRYLTKAGTYQHRL
ncbi:adaptor complexes medium subunit family protein [Toxoplasma gondii GAB2-2007-GAL-DOM2]|uniref:Adaptor complexes medium subunit family protein n=4 Tax=Toxoplasma gondii TaxID=5811 RepID=S7V2R3_TOXGG|nr:adaptor complexes medium subunit family protein [Toxoplasma gondii GT1]KAF4641713.1 adaptor complexes medium subunit family protein [Toxoplasma gondii]KFG48391.1 adaptor complexes medium subunit family protein [Toxoplasma gondii GAB2-2007-GAL-DOM2]